MYICIMYIYICMCIYIVCVYVWGYVYVVCVYVWGYVYICTNICVCHTRTHISGIVSAITVYMI